MTDQVAVVLQSLADKFGVTVTYLWPRLVAYTFWHEAANVAIEVFFLTLAAWVLWTYAHHFKRLASDLTEEELVREIIVGIAACAVGFLGIVALLSFPNNLAGMMAPEGKAIYDLFAAIGGKGR